MIKKRLISTCITCVITALLAGCGARNPGAESLITCSPSPSATCSPEASYSIGNTGNDSGTQEGTDSDLSENEKLYFLGSSDIFCLNENDEVFSIFTFPKNEYARDVCALDGEIYAVGYEFGNGDAEVTDSYIHYLNTEDPSKNTDVRVPDEYNKYIELIGIYDGKLYFEYNESMTDRKPGTFDGKEIVFGTDIELFEYEKELKEEGLEQIIYGLDAVNSLVKYGAIFRRLEGTDVIVRVDSDGQVHMLNPLTNDIDRFTDFYGDYALASTYEYDGDYNLVHGVTYLYDLTTDYGVAEDTDTAEDTAMTDARLVMGDSEENPGPVRIIDEFTDSTIKTFLGYEDGYLYYRQNVERLSQPDLDYFKMDVNKTTDEAVKLCRKTYNLFEHLPELSKSVCFDQYKIGKNVFLYQRMRNDNLEWFKVYPDGRQKRTEAVVCTVNSASYGDASRDTHHYYYKDSGEQIEYYEYSIDRYSLKKDAVKENLWLITIKLEELYSQFENECIQNKSKNHSLAEDEYILKQLRETKQHATDSMEFEAAELIKERYFQIAFGYRSYWANALNGEYACRHYLFDTQAGEEIGIKDLYPGTLDEFKKLVADYALEYWKNSGEEVFVVPYNEDEDDAMYRDFADKADFEMDFELGDEGFTVFYPPYIYTTDNMGALGITIPYDAAGIKL